MYDCDQFLLPGTKTQYKGDNMELQASKVKMGKGTLLIETLDNFFDVRFFHADIQRLSPLPQFSQKLGR
jgi:hypothetical protein